MTVQQPPQQLKGRYHLTRQLGSGGMAWVYLAHDTLLNRDVAIKFLSPESLQYNDTLSERFMREARAVARLAHPNIVTLFDIGIEGTWHFQVMEYMAGDTLHKLLHDNSDFLTLKDKIEIIRDVLTALAYAHENNLIHRDIKPENILMTHDNKIKVADFGLALAQEDVRLTQNEAIVGTALYMAPEMITGEVVDHRVDLYAVGAVFYEMLTGQTPFTGNTSLQIFTSVLQEPLTAPRLLNPGIPDAIEVIVTCLLEKNPDNRYGSARKVLEALPDETQLRNWLEADRAEITRERLSRPLMERLVRSSSTHRHRNISETIADDKVMQSSDDDELAPDVFLYAAQGDLVDAIETERRNSARLLQENVIDHLNMLVAQLGAYEQMMTTQQSMMAINVISALVRQIIQQARDLEARLRPATLETLGLEAALDVLASQEMRSRRLDVILSVARMSERLPLNIELTLFRATQDSIDRAIRQSRADQIHVSLQRKANAVRLQVDDNGVLPQIGQMLLIATQQRVQGLGGSLDIRQSSYGGLSVTVRFELMPVVELTERETDVIVLLVEGLSNKDIATLLYISPRTVKFHLDNIYSKLGVNTRTEAAIYALKQGWVRKPPAHQT